MNKKNKDTEIKFNLLRLINKNPEYSQREIAFHLGLSLGKINYLLKELTKKGLIKIDNFSKNKNKFGYIYLLTPKGIVEKTSLAINFMRRKLNEYDELKKELDNDKKSKKYTAKK